MQIKHRFDSVADDLAGFDLENIEVILLGGPGNAKKEFLGGLQKGIAAKTVAIEGLNLSSGDEKIDATIIGQLDRLRKGLELRQLTKVKESIKRGLFLTENQEICRALEAGAVDTVLIASDYHAATPKEKEMILKMIEVAEASAAEIEFITNKEILGKLHRYGSVVASLRYSPF
jgi:stalled ribosome rescue protein Dom34